MLNRNIYIGCFALLLSLQSCGSAKYIYDGESRKRQSELNKHRSGNVFKDVGATLASFIFSAALERDFFYIPEGQEFKKLKIQNPSEDTLYVNMLTDVYWDAYNYCDFMDIRIPSGKKCKLLVPTGAAYNIYFSHTPQNDDDEMIEFVTGRLKKISLYPGLTIPDEPNNQNK